MVLSNEPIKGYEGIAGDCNGGSAFANEGGDVIADNNVVIASEDPAIANDSETDISLYGFEDAAYDYQGKPLCKQRVFCLWRKNDINKASSNN